MEFDQTLHMHDLNQIYVGNVTGQFSQITRVMALEYCQNLVSTHYLEKLMELEQILHMH